MCQYAIALEGVKAQPTEIGASRTRAGTISALCVSYYRSPEFRAFSSQRRRPMRRNIIERFRAAHGDKPVKGLAVHISSD